MFKLFEFLVTESKAYTNIEILFGNLQISLIDLIESKRNSLLFVLRNLEGYLFWLKFIDPPRLGKQREILRAVFII